MINKNKIVIIGAGFVGSSIAYACALKQMGSEIVLIDMNPAKAEGEALDISHGTFFSGNMTITAGTYKDIIDSSIIIITAGVNRKPGDTRLDLAEKNSKIMKSISNEIMKYYTDQIIIMASNPVDVLTYMFHKWTGICPSKIIGTGTTLDTSRFHYLLSKRIDVDVSNIHGCIIGEHGDSQVTVWSSATILNNSLMNYCTTTGVCFDQETRTQIENEIKQSGSDVISKKGATYFGIASVVSSIIDSILNSKNSIYTVSTIMNGMYGLSDLAISYPAIINHTGVKSLVSIHLEEDEHAKFIISANKLKETILKVSEKVV